MWAEYFPFAKIIGIDKEKFKISSADHRIFYKYYNANKPDTIRSVLKNEHPNIIIDDASHIYAHQQQTFFSAFEILHSGGVYFIEDLNSVQGTYIEGYQPTEQVFSSGLRNLKLCPPYLRNSTNGDKVLNKILKIEFYRSFFSKKP